MTAKEFRALLKEYQRRRNLNTLTEAVNAFAAEMVCSSGAVWHWLAGERQIRPMMALMVERITEGN